MFPHAENTCRSAATFEPVLMLKEYEIKPLGNKRFSLNVTLEHHGITTEDLDLIIATSASNVQFETAKASLGVIWPENQRPAQPSFLKPEMMLPVSKILPSKLK